MTYHHLTQLNCIFTFKQKWKSFSSILKQSLSWIRFLISLYSESPPYEHSLRYHKPCHLVVTPLSTHRRWDLRGFTVQCCCSLQEVTCGRISFSIQTNELKRGASIRSSKRNRAASPPVIVDSSLSSAALSEEDLSDKDIPESQAAGGLALLFCSLSRNVEVSHRDLSNVPQWFSVTQWNGNIFNWSYIATSAVFEGDYRNIVKWDKFKREF